MTALDRKKYTENRLIELNIPINTLLPAIEEEYEVKIQSISDIVKRILILTYFGIYAEGGNKEEIVEYLKTEQLWECVSENERKLFIKNELSAKDKINISWRSEAMYILFWAINKLDITELPIEQCSVPVMMKLLPRYLKPLKDFIDSATIRNIEEILNKSDLIYRLHWAARQAHLEKTVIPANMDISILQEWHYAINWITSSEVNWDDIKTDT